MNGNIHLVIVLIDDAYHLLIRVASGHTHEPAKLSDAVIHMHDIVAWLHLLQFLHGERHLAGTCGVAAQTVFMEPVEYLMVGEETDLHTVIGKALVNGFVYGGEDGIRGGCGRLSLRRGIRLGIASALKRREDFAEPLLLLGTIGKDIETVSAHEIIVERLAQKVEILMEKGLGGDIEGDCRLRGARGFVTKFHTAEGCGIFGELRRCEQLPFPLHITHNLLLLHLSGTLHTFRHRLGRKSVVINLFDGVVDIDEIFHHEDGILRKEMQERHFLGRYLRQFGHNLDLLTTVLGELILHFKGADGVDVIAKEVDTEGIFAGIGIDVEDAATQSKLSWLVDIILFHETEILQRVYHKRDIDGLPRLQSQSSLIKILT